MRRFIAAARALAKADADQVHMLPSAEHVESIQGTECWLTTEPELHADPQGETE